MNLKKPSDLQAAPKRQDLHAQMKQDKLRANQVKRNFGDKNSQVPIHYARLDFETFKERYKSFSTLRNIVYCIHERLLQAQEKKRLKRQKSRQDRLSVIKKELSTKKQTKDDA